MLPHFLLPLWSYFSSQPSASPSLQSWSSSTSWCFVLGIYPTSRFSQRVIGTHTQTHRWLSSKGNQLFSPLPFFLLDEYNVYRQRFILFIYRCNRNLPNMSSWLFKASANLMLWLSNCQLKPEKQLESLEVRFFLSLSWAQVWASQITK